MGAICNFHKVSDLLACAGQPREGQLVLIAEDGYRVVINLGLADGNYALKDEAASVTGLGLEYHHIPVLFDSPQVTELSSFIELMNKHANEKIFVHCAANYRASVFTGLYLFSAGKLDEEAMQEFIEDIWQPDPAWQSFIEESLVVLKDG
ncbi:MAG TPA: protein tyrosine phosphatase family protein [Mucilaginibacter sp.]|jgi:protein tyrosine phosphatase (PTP) superfamily phosphohydrolase (DUF442 family)